MNAVAATLPRATAPGSAGSTDAATGRQTPPERPTIEDLRRRLMAGDDLRCEFCGETFESRRKLGGHRPWCEANPNRRTKRAGAARRPAPRVTHDPLPGPPADPPGSTRSADGRLHRADHSPDRLALADASIRDLEAALRAKLLGVRREIDAELRALGYVEPEA